MNNTKIMPTKLKAVIGIHIFRISSAILFLVLVAFLMSNNFEAETFWMGMKQAFIDKLGINESDSVASTIGYLSGGMLIPIILMILQIILIKRGKNHTATWIVSLLDIVFSFGNGSFPFLPGICLLILLSNSTKRYFNGDFIETDVNILDDI